VCVCVGWIQEHTPKGSEPFESCSLDETQGTITHQLRLPLTPCKTNIRHFIVQVHVSSELYKQLTGEDCLAELLLVAARQWLHELTNIPIAEMRF
jgi:hypothetical protein